MTLPKRFFPSVSSLLISPSRLSSSSSSTSSLPPLPSVRKITRNSPCFTPDCPGKISALQVKSGRGNQMKVLKVLVQFREVNLRREKQKLAETKRRAREIEQERARKEQQEKDEELRIRLEARAVELALQAESRAAEEAARRTREATAAAAKDLQLQKDAVERKIKQEAREKARQEERETKAREAERLDKEAKQREAERLERERDVAREKEYRQHLATLYATKEQREATPPYGSTSRDSSSLLRANAPAAVMKQSYALLPNVNSPATPLRPIPSFGTSGGTSSALLPSSGASPATPLRPIATPFHSSAATTPAPRAPPGSLSFAKVAGTTMIGVGAAGAQSEAVSPALTNASAPGSGGPPANWASLMGGGSISSTSTASTSSSAAAAAAAAAALASKLSRKQKKDRASKPSLSPSPSTAAFNSTVAYHGYGSGTVENPFSILRSDMVVGGLVRCKSMQPTRYLYVQHFPSLQELQSQCAPFGCHSVTSCYNPLAALIEFEDVTLSAACHSALNGAYFARYADDPLMVWLEGENEALPIVLPSIVPYIAAQQQIYHPSQSHQLTQLQLSKREKAKLKRQEAIAASKDERIRRRMEKAQYRLERGGMIGGPTGGSGSMGGMDGGMDGDGDLDGNDSPYGEDDSPFLSALQSLPLQDDEVFPALGGGNVTTAPASGDSHRIANNKSPSQSATSRDHTVSNSRSSSPSLDSQQPRDRDDTFLFSIFSGTGANEDQDDEEAQQLRGDSGGGGERDHKRDDPDGVDLTASPTRDLSSLSAAFTRQTPSQAIGVEPLTSDEARVFSASDSWSLFDPSAPTSTTAASTALHQRRASWMWQDKPEERVSSDADNKWPSSNTNAGTALNWLEGTSSFLSSSSALGPLVSSPPSPTLSIASSSGAAVDRSSDPLMAGAEADAFDEDADIGGDGEWQLTGSQSLLLSPAATTTMSGLDASDIDLLRGGNFNINTNWNLLDMPSNALNADSGLRSFLARSFAASPPLIDSNSFPPGDAAAPSTAGSSSSSFANSAGIASSFTGANASSASAPPSSVKNTVNINLNVQL